MINGILNLYKEPGWTSNDVVCKLRGILGQKKIGHTGTLDPDAVGVLPVCLGSGTKVCDLLTDQEKEYEAVLRLGITTDTQDLSGSVLSECDVQISPEDVIRAAESFLGTYEQIPPMFSARKVNGKKLYEYARAGVEIERKPKAVTIHAIEAVPYTPDRERTAIGQVTLPDAADDRFYILRVRCSKGTYVRTLIHDIGMKLGCGASMAALTRTQVGTFTLADTVSLGQLQELKNHQDMEAILSLVTGVDQLFSDCPGCRAADDQALARILNGNAVPSGMLRMYGEDGAEKSGNNELKNGLEQIRVYDQHGDFLALYGYNAAHRVYTPIKMFTARNV